MATVGIDLAKIETHVKLPLDWILVRLDPPQRKTLGGIEIPDTILPEARSGIVITRGPGAIADDGKTRLPVSCRVGERIWFEASAGKFLPHVPRVSGPKGYGYKLIRDGSVNALVEADPSDIDEELPPASGPIPVSRCIVGGPGWLDRLQPVQDWMLVRLDNRAETHQVRRLPAIPLVTPSGQQIHLGPDRDQMQREDTWTVVVLRRGPGLITTTRCLDGDRVGKAPDLVKAGDRIIACGTAPNVQAIDYAKDWSAPGMVVLMREYPCYCGTVEPGA
jgi:co-chaperonin GroES (HSP10)